MLKLSLFIILQSVLLVAAQTLLKISVQLFGKFSFTWIWFKNALTTWQFALSGICALAAMLIWMYVLKHYPMSVAYPLLSISYIIGVLAGQFVFHETIPLLRWIGVIIIIIGAIIVSAN
ncbi:MAG: EamA family transporter [Bacteroidales bacterium]|jgi:undecaprenyl phosphate-alpha-L-ara4N flippase subunit ArnE|nr:EamA family transporter [Bacteroidales bacterium]